MSWLAQANTSNRWKQTYIQGFVDISGGSLILRNSEALFYSNINVSSASKLVGPVSVGSNVINPSIAFSVFGNTNLAGNLNVVGNTTLSNLFVSNNSQISGSINVSGNATVVGTTQLSNVNVLRNATIGGGLTVSGIITATSFNATSDRRLKNNIMELKSQIKSIMQIQPVSFEWNPDGRKDYGFIAQDIYNTYPILRPDFKDIHPNSSLDEPTDANDNPIYYSIDYGRMTPFLWQAMREIIQKLDSLESRVNLLECNNK
jgi:hypothetical protein